ncbi:hypothetical protein TNCV_4970021 [Trichonephila clavipes]|nr:hypothetical protein TNCV_4970021 [Trichonephila clavipes]
MCEENEERSVDKIKETAKEGINPVILSKEPVHLDDDEIEKVKQKLAKPKVTIHGDLCYETLWDRKKCGENLQGRNFSFPLRSDKSPKMTGVLKSTWRTKERNSAECPFLQHQLKQERN